jgi:hypothetical protein
MTSDELKAIYASAPVNSTAFEVITLSAPWYSRTYHLQNVYTGDLEVTLETAETVTAEYAPMSLAQANSNADLNYEREIVIQMLNDLIAAEMDRFDPSLYSWLDQTITVRSYIYYRDGTVSSLQSTPVEMPIRDITNNTIGSKIRVASKPSNESATGEIATIARVPMLKPYA